MELIPENRIFKFNHDQLNSVRKQYNLEKPGDMSRAIDVLEAWIKMQVHFKKKELPRNFLEKAILASKGSLERVKSKLDKICTLRTVIPEFFGENLTKNSFEDIDMFISTLLPRPTDENNRIYFIKTKGTLFTAEILMNFFRYVVLISEYIMAYDYNDGIILAADYSETSIIEFVKALNLSDLRQIITIFIEGFGMRLKGIHFITPSKAIDMFVTIVKQFLSPKLGQRIYIHKDITTFYEYVPKDLLPIEYGGQEKSLETLRDELLAEVTKKEFMNYIEEMNKAKTDESYRGKDKFNEKYLGLPGSFRTLNVD